MNAPTEKARLFLTLWAILLLVLAVNACAPADEQGAEGTQQSATETRMSAEDAMREAATRWDDAQRAGSVDGLMALYIPAGAAASPPDAPTATGNDAIRAVFAELFGASGGNDVTDTVTSVVESGDIAVGRGTYVWNKTDESGAAVSESGKWLTLSRWQPDGSLQLVHNIWNRDAAPAGAEPPPPIAESGPAAAADAVCASSPMALDQAFETDIEAGDVAALVASHAPNGERLPPGMPAMSGREEIARYLESRITLFSERVLDLTDIAEGIEGDLGWTTGHFRFDYTPKDGGEAVVGEGSYMAVSQRADDGCWRYRWVLWNYDAPRGET